jgi:hypothetical protein
VRFAAVTTPSAIGSVGIHCIPRVQGTSFLSFNTLSVSKLT